MMKIHFLAILFVFCFTQCKQNNKIIIQEFSKEIGIYSPLFVNFNIENTFENPYDQDIVTVDALIDGPDNQSIVLPCFYLSDSNLGSNWQARFTPRLAGDYSLKIRVTQNNQHSFSKPVQFKVVSSNAKGFLSFNNQDPYFMKFDNGEKYKGLGLNVGWYYEPKWDTKIKYSFPGFFKAMNDNNANFMRMWICPWNYPIHWTPVVTYSMLTEEFNNWDNVMSHSFGLTISQGNTAVTQSDIGQLIKTSSSDEEIIYKLDSIRAVKLMIYYKGSLNKDNIEILTSADNITYNKIITEYSDSWESAEGWRRIFLFSFGEINQAANFAKIVFKGNLKKDSVKFSGIQFKYGSEISRLDCNGLSRFSQVNSAKLDTLFDLALSNNIYMILCLGYHGQFNPIMDSWGVNDEWQRNPFNIKNGGPCEKPADFFTNKIAIKHYKNYLRYFVARWGYQTEIIAWEFWNEIDIAMRSHKVPEADIVSWHKEMADYLASIDPFKHVISTSLSWGDMPDLWKLDNITLTQVHRYSPSKDFVKQTIDYVNKYNKQHIIGEYAISWKGPGNDFPYEVYEEEFHDGMWRGLFTPVALLPISWWWDHHYDQGEYFHFKSLATVIEEMKKEKNVFAPLTIQGNKDFEIHGLTTGNLSVVWVKKLGKSNILDLNIPVNTNRNYMATVIDTWTNENTELFMVSAVNNQINLKSLNLDNKKDLVIMIH